MTYADMPATKTDETQTLAEHAEAWARENELPVPVRPSAEWDEMYKRWIEFAFPTEAATPMSIAAVRRMFSPGVRYIGEFIGENRKRAPSDAVRSERTVLKQTAKEMVALIETGSHAGREIDLEWRGVTATMCGRIVTLYMPDPFLTLERIETAGDCR